jgi:hypothetical protein
MLLLNLAFAHWAWRKRVANQEARSLIKADHWVSRVIGQSVQCQNLFKPGQKGGVDRAEAPGLMAMGF